MAQRTEILRTRNLSNELILKSNSNKFITLAYHYKRKRRKEPFSIQSNYDGAAGPKRGKYMLAGHNWRVLSASHWLNSSQKRKRSTTTTNIGI